MKHEGSDLSSVWHTHRKPKQTIHTCLIGSCYSLVLSKCSWVKQEMVSLSIAVNNLTEYDKYAAFEMQFYREIKFFSL